jgi:conjugation system ATPase, TraG family
MKVTAEQAYGINGIIENAIISKSGCLSLPFWIENPECYSLDIEGIYNRHHEFFKAFKQLPAGVYVHKQDVFIRQSYNYDKTQDTFLQNAEKKHFDGRKYVQSYSILTFSYAGFATLQESYVKNPLAYQDNLVKQDKEKLVVFLEAVEGAVTILNNLPRTKLHAMSDVEIKNYMFDYVNGFFDDKGVRDIRFSDMIEIGDKKGVFFALCDENFFPDKVDLYTIDNSLETSNSELYMNILEKLGVHLHCTHVVNQIWKFEGTRLREELDKRVKIFGQHQDFDKEIAQKHKYLSEYQDEILEENNILCRCHFNVMLLENDSFLLERMTEQVKEVFRMLDFKYYIPAFEGLYEMYIGCIIGRENKLYKDYYFFTDLHASLCFNINYSTFKSDEDGILFNERLYQTPTRVDIWDAKKKRVPARNAIIVASTGGGKSVSGSNIVQQLTEQNYKLVVVEFGKSFYQLVQLYPEKSLHVDYNGQDPLGINPFLIETETPAPEKLKSLVMLVLKFLRTPWMKEDVKQVVSLTKILLDYYVHTKTEHSFPSFYHYVRKNYVAIFERNEIKAEYFDIETFIHVGSEFMPGGIYENVCKPSKLSEEIRDKNLIVFELTQIKKDPFLTSVVMSLIGDTVEHSILSDRSTRGLLLFDEYAETQAMVDVFSGDDIHSTVAFFYQKLRKENGAIYTIIQQPSQLPDNNYTKGIIGNTQILYVLPTTETVYDDVIQAFHMKNQSHINLMKSIKNNFSAKRPYSEVFIRFGDHYATVVRLELSREKYFAFQTEGDDWTALQLLTRQIGRLDKSIEKYINDKNIM